MHKTTSTHDFDPQLLCQYPQLQGTGLILRFTWLNAVNVQASAPYIDEELLIITFFKHIFLPALLFKRQVIFSSNNFSISEIPLRLYVMHIGEQTRLEDEKGFFEKSFKI